MLCYFDFNHSEAGVSIDIVSAQDYHEGGPHAHSHRTKVYPHAPAAYEAAMEWAEKHGYQPATVDEVARAQS